MSDLINGLFELLGAVMIWSNVKRIQNDKQVRGVNWKVSGFFWGWGIWNLFYYPHLAQWWSFTGGMAICGANFVWLYYAIRYRSN